MLGDRGRSWSQSNGQESSMLSLKSGSSNPSINRKRGDGAAMVVKVVGSKIVDGQQRRGRGLMTML